MKTIIAGSRNICNPTLLFRALVNIDWTITEVVSRGARGVDAMGEAWAENAGIPVKRFPADWKTHGKSAGILRNEQMAVYSDALLAIWDGESKGTKHMIKTAKGLGLKVFVFPSNDMALIKIGRLLDENNG